LTVQNRSEPLQDPPGPAPGNGSAGRGEAASPWPFQAADPHLNIIPVDPHRLFVHWWVAPETLERARRQMGAPAAAATLTLRILRLGEPGNGARAPSDLEDFTLGAGWHERFFSLREPGGRVAGALGIKEEDGRFTPMLTSLPVTLPQAPAGWPEAIRAAPGPAPENLADAGIAAPPSAATPAEPPPPVLDEQAILAAAARLENLPPELRRLPGEPAEAETPPTVRDELPAPPPGSPPETPALNERQVLIAALGSQLAADPGEQKSPAVGAPDAPGISPETTSSRLASQVEAARVDAPVQVQATLIINGRVRPGHRLRVGHQEIAVRPDGGFTCQHRVDFFPAAWSLLLQAAAQPESGAAPSLELLTRIPDAGALLTLDSCVEIEGQVRDPGYRVFLPAGVNVDAAGRFRLVRSLPPGALFLPHLVLIGERAAAG
jgi:hypothetical protein